MKKGLLPFAIVLVVLFTGCRTPQPQLTRPIQVTASVTNRVFLASLAGQLGHSFLPGNRLEPLQNGAEFVPAMLAAIRSASNSVNLEVFIWRSGRMSEEFIAALTERARAGVEVRVVADALGTLKFKDEDQQRLRAAGVQFVRYNKPRLWRLDRLNFRDHRKLLIVDGNVGFTGGMCIADEWLGNAETKDRWRDTQVEVRGPVVAQMQGSFAANWLELRGQMLFGEKFYPALEQQGDALAQNIISGRSDGEDARLVYLSAMAAAKQRIRLSHSYFVPDDLALQELLRARQRGVEVEIISPGNIDANVVRRASRAFMPELLRAGVKIYEYGPAMLHNKILIVDDVFVSCGSVNFDERSFRINDESNINVLDREFAAKLIDAFERDKAQSKPLTLADIKKSPWYVRTCERLATLFRSQL